ncbi:MAG: hypothetical protein V2A34_16415 [Lentisphaerota bacterium]
MSKEKSRNESSKKTNVVSEINDSLYALAAYLSEYVSLLRGTETKTGLR